MNHTDTLRAALAELVAVKDLKDRTEALHFAGPLSEHGEGWKAVYDAGRAEYIRRQPLAWEAARAALAATETQDDSWKLQSVTLSALQLHEALEFAAPDFDEDEDQRETEVCIAWAPENTVRNDEGGFEAPGYVVWLEEYPEEGCMPLDGGNPRPHSAVSRDIAKHHAGKTATAAIDAARKG